MEYFIIGIIVVILIMATIIKAIINRLCVLEEILSDEEIRKIILQAVKDSTEKE